MDESPTPPLVAEADAERLRGASEKEFRAWFYTRSAKRAHLTLGLAQALVLLTAAIDLVVAPDAAARTAVLIKLGLICPLPFVTLWVSRQERWSHLFPHFMCGSIVAVGLAFSLIGLGDGLDFRARYDTLVVVTVFTYFLGGLASYLASITGLSLLALYVAVNYAADTPLPQMAYESLFLLAVNAIGMLSANNMEANVQEAFARARVLADLSERDPLTKLLNRRGFSQRLETIWSRAISEGKPLAIAMIDLDHFKGINDRLGHAAGDQALSEVAEVLRGMATRPLDASVRWGGEEFLVIWYDVDRARAQRLAERVRAAVEGLQLSNESSPAGVLTVSIGVYACRPSADLHADECLDRADQAQYQAKQSGRNRVVVA